MEGKRVTCLQSGRITGRVDKDKNIVSTDFVTFGKKIGMVKSSGMCFSTDIKTFGLPIGRVDII